MAAPMLLSKYFGNLSKIIDSERIKAYSSTDFVDIDLVSYSDFFANYLVPNKPCIFSPTLTRNWKSRQEWVSVDGAPNFDFLVDEFGEATVPVANCKQEEYNSHPKTEMLMTEYIEYWKKYRDSNYDETESCLYLKDWHFIKRFPDYKAYKTPVYFQSDWLNEYWDTLPKDDYRFVYMGPKGTWTPFHADVFRSYSWSANICGKKKWIFYPPGCEESLKDRHGNLIYDIMSPDLDDLEKYPHAHKVKGQRLEVIQGQGQVIFVPSGWHHQVFNLEDTISINHNWLNGCNIDICWKHLYDNLINVKHEIEDCKNMEGWTEQCQLILKATAGMDYLQFIDMLKVITSHRLLKYHQLIKLSCSCEVKSTCLKKGVGKIDDHNNNGHNDDKDNNKSGDNDDKKDIGNTNGVYEDDGGGDVNEDGNFEDDGDDNNDDNGGCNDNKSDDHNNVDGDDNKKNTGNNVYDDDDDNDDGCCDDDEIRTDDLNNCDKNLESDFKRCDMTSNETVTDKCSCDVDEKISLASICQNCGKMKFKSVHEHNFSMQDWVEGDYLIFDLQRIEEVLNVIIQDFDYQLIDKVPEQTAEYVLELINKGIDLCLCK